MAYWLIVITSRCKLFDMSLWYNFEPICYWLTAITSRHVVFLPSASVYSSAASGFRRSLCCKASQTFGKKRLIVSLRNVGLANRPVILQGEAKSFYEL